MKAPMFVERQAVGQWGESVTAGVLEAQGGQVLARNWRPDTRLKDPLRPRGELDLILSTPQGLVAYEVKTRTTENFGHPFEAITEPKSRRLRLLAEAFLRERQCAGPIRVDAVAVTGDPDGFRFEILRGVA